jgi:hypothetical protein
MQINKKKFYGLAKDIVDKNNIIYFLNIVSLNISLDTNNLMLLYKQDKNMTTVCGKKAWESFGRQVQDGAPVYQIMAPKLILKNDTLNVEYDFVGVIDAKYTIGGSFKPKPSPHYISDTLVGLTNRTIEIVSPDKLQDKYNGAEYNSDNNVFYVSNRLTDNRRAEAIIRAYVKFYLAEMSEYNYQNQEDVCLLNSVVYILYRLYDLDAKFKGVLFRDLELRTEEEAYSFVNNTVFIARDIMQKLNFAFLTFDEIMIFNSISGFSDKNDKRTSGADRKVKMKNGLEKVTGELCDKDKEITASADEFFDKLENCCDEDVAKMYKEAQEKGFLPSYPPFEFSIKATKKPKR